MSFALLFTVGCVHGGTTTLALRARVPEAAPDSVPAVIWDSLIDPANLITDPPGITGTFIRNLVYVQFVDGTKQSERQCAIDAIRGEVVGGMTLGDPEHFYAVRIPYRLSPDDSASGPILRAIATLDGNSKVAAAAPANMDAMEPKTKSRSSAPILRARAQPKRNPKVKLAILAGMGPPVSYAPMPRVPLPPSIGFSSRQKLIVDTQRDTTPRVTLVPPDTTPVGLFQSLGAITGPASLGGGQYLKDILMVEFKLGTTLSLRRAALDSVAGTVVGGKVYEEGGDGTYYVRVAGGTFSSLGSAIVILRRQPQVAVARWWDLTQRSDQTHRGP